MTSEFGTVGIQDTSDLQNQKPIIRLGCAAFKEAAPKTVFDDQLGVQFDHCKAVSLTFSSRDIIGNMFN
jgi:hypothetical protein